MGYRNSKQAYVGVEDKLVGNNAKNGSSMSNENVLYCLIWLIVFLVLLWERQFLKVLSLFGWACGKGNRV